MKSIVFVVSILICIFSLNSDKYWSPWIPLEVMAVMVFCNTIIKRYGYVASICFGYPILLSMYIFSIYTPEDNHEILLRVKNISLQTTFSFMCVVLGVGLLKSRTHKFFEETFPYLCVLNSVLIIIETFFVESPTLRIGFLNNASMAGCFTACTFPYLVFKKTKRHIIFDMVALVSSIWAIFLVRSSIPLATFGVVIFSYILVSDNFSNMKNKILTGIVTILTITGAGILFIPDIMKDSGRYEIWSTVYGWWSRNVNQWFGIGNGEWIYLGPKIQREFKIETGPPFGWAHNDWLQILIELGYVGLFFTSLLFVYALLRCYIKRRNYEFSALCGLGFTALLNFPLRLAPFALVSAVIFARALDKRREPESD